MAKRNTSTDIDAPSEPLPDTDNPADPNVESLPAPADTRPYLWVRPSADPLALETIRTGFRRLHALDHSKETKPWYRRLFRSPTPPTIECLFVSPALNIVHYYVGIDDPEAFDALERLLRGVFPDSYEIEQVDLAPDQLVPERADPDTPGDSTRSPDDHALAAVEFHGRADRRTDWQTCLTSVEQFLADEPPTVPLTAVVETLAAHPGPAIYQTLLQAKPDWTTTIEERRISIEANQDTIRDQLINVLAGPPDEHADTLSAGDEARLDELETKDARHSFEVNARAVLLSDLSPADSADTATTDTERTAHELASALSPIGHTCYQIEGSVSTGSRAERVRDAIRERTFTPPTYQRLGTHVPWTKNRSPGIVADPTEAPNFCLLGGDALTAAGKRALALTPGERTAIPRPPPGLLATYRAPGLTLGTPLTQDGTSDGTPIALPRELQTLHVGWIGKTGSGKTTALINAILDNHATTDGADILIDPKGDGMIVEYCRAHYARFGTLDDVLYFDCAEVLPAFSFFDIRDELDAGVPRTTAVEDTVDHYIEILIQIMGRDRFEQAVRSPDVLRYLVKAAFDPVHGGDAFTHRDLHASARQMHERQSAPSVSDPDLEQALGGIVANRARTFDEIMAGVANRIEKIPVDQRLARIFNHVPDPDGEDPHFDLADYLDEDVVIIFDTGGLRSEAQRVLALVLLSNLWTALRRRKARDPDGPHPLVNCYIEEAASLAVSDLLIEFLSESRGFEFSLTLSMQFPAQLRAIDEAAFEEVLNNVSTVIVGNVPDPADRRLAERLATDDMDQFEVGYRLGALQRGRWLVSLPAPFDDHEPRPFYVKSLPLPPGDPDGPSPLPPEEHSTFEAALETLEARTLSEVALTVGSPSATPQDEDEEALDPTQVRVDSALPHTLRMPPTVEYATSIHALRCTECDNRYDPTSKGMVRAIECCSSLEDVDPADIPICELNLKLTPEELTDSEWSVTQLLFCQAVYNAQQLRYGPPAYDLCYDSMIRLQEYVGIESDAVQDLLDAGLLRHDTDHPHRLYTVTPDGREVIGEAYRQGVDYGHGKGDLEESSEHVLGIVVGERLVTQEFIENPDSPAVELSSYHEVEVDGEIHRLDIAALDEAGDVVVAVEVERINHDYRRAVPEDYDKMAACDPDAAIWIVMTQSDGHNVLTALNDPPDGEPRVEKTYAKTTPPQQFRIETPGLTAMYPAEYVRDQLLASE